MSRLSSKKCNANIQRSMTDFFSKQTETKPKISFAKGDSGKSFKPIATVQPQNKVKAETGIDFSLFEDDDYQDFDTSLASSQVLKVAHRKSTSKKHIVDRQIDEDVCVKPLRRRSKVIRICSSDEESYDEVIEDASPIKIVHGSNNCKKNGPSEIKNEATFSKTGNAENVDIFQSTYDNEDDIEYFESAVLSPPVIYDEVEDVLHSINATPKIQPAPPSASDKSLESIPNMEDLSSSINRSSGGVINPEESYLDVATNSLNVSSSYSNDHQIEQILKHPVFRVYKLENEDRSILNSLKEDVASIICKLFMEMSPDALKCIPQYNIIQHIKVANAYKKITKLLRSCHGEVSQSSSTVQQTSHCSSKNTVPLVKRSPFLATTQPIMSTPVNTQPPNGSPVVMPRTVFKFKPVEKKGNGEAASIKGKTSTFSSPTFKGIILPKRESIECGESFYDTQPIQSQHSKNLPDRTAIHEGNSLRGKASKTAARSVQGPSGTSTPCFDMGDEDFFNFDMEELTDSSESQIIPAPTKLMKLPNPSSVKKINSSFQKSPSKCRTGEADNSKFKKKSSSSPSKFFGNVRNDGATGKFSGLSYPHSSIMLQTFGQCFGLKTFRENQKEVINAALLGEDCFVLMPTGGGKSLCYQLPACMGDGVSIVISPLKALIQDQMQKLSSLDITAGRLSGDVTASEESFVYSDLMRMEPTIKLLYVTPEKISASQRFQNIMDTLYNRGRLSRFIVDEAHCVSQWGHDFRPDYKRLNMLRNQYSSVPFMALTATATPRVRTDILHQLGLINTNWFLSSFNRTNLRYEVLHKKGKTAIDSIAELIKKQFKNSSGIIYCLSRMECDQTAGKLTQLGISATSYHAGMTDKQRELTQDRWINDKCKIVCATIAFGMGIDKPNVRFVIHYSMPKSVEGYYQESGRAGRDGEVAHCLLYYSYHDMLRIRKMIELDKENYEAKRTHFDNLYRMVAYCENKTDCRRAQLLNYFGEIFNRENCKSHRATACDNCLQLGSFQKIDVTKECKAIVDAISRLCSTRGWKSNFTLNHFVDIFKGSEVKKVMENGHNRLDLHGIGKSWQRNDAERLLRKLVLESYLTEELIMNRENIANAFVRPGPKANMLLQLNSTHKISFDTKAKFAADAKPDQVEEEDDSELANLKKDCYEALLNAVKAIALERNVNYTNMINLAALRAMSESMPESEEEMRKIPHITKANYDKFGQVLLDITQGYAAQKIVMMDEKLEEANNGTNSANGNQLGTLQQISAPDPNHSPYFGSANPPQRRGVKRYRGGGRKGKRYTSQSRGQKNNSKQTNSFQVSFSSRGRAKATTRGRSVSGSSRGASSSAIKTPSLGLLSAPKPRSFLPPPKVYQL